jgi:hypothetical protein
VGGTSKRGFKREKKRIYTYIYICGDKRKQRSEEAAARAHFCALLLGALEGSAQGQGFLLELSAFVARFVGGVRGGVQLRLNTRTHTQETSAQESRHARKHARGKPGSRKNNE